MKPRTCFRCMCRPGGHRHHEAIPSLNMAQQILMIYPRLLSLAPRLGSRVGNLQPARGQTGLNSWLPSRCQKRTTIPSKAPQALTLSCHLLLLHQWGCPALSPALCSPLHTRTRLLRTRRTLLTLRRYTPPAAFTSQNITEQACRGSITTLTQSPGAAHIGWGPCQHQKRAQPSRGMAPSAGRRHTCRRRRARRCTFSNLPWIGASRRHRPPRRLLQWLLTCARVSPKPVALLFPQGCKCLPCLMPLRS